MMRARFSLARRARARRDGRRRGRAGARLELGSAQIYSAAARSRRQSDVGGEIPARPAPVLRQAPLRQWDDRLRLLPSAGARLHRRARRLRRLDGREDAAQCAVDRLFRLAWHAHLGQSGAGDAGAADAQSAARRATRSRWARTTQTRRRSSRAFAPTPIIANGSRRPFPRRSRSRSPSTTIIKAISAFQRGVYLLRQPLRSISARQDHSSPRPSSAGMIFISARRRNVITAMAASISTINSCTPRRARRRRRSTTPASTTSTGRAPIRRPITGSSTSPATRTTWASSARRACATSR